MSDHEVESIVVLPLPPRYRLKDLLLGEQHSEDDRFVLRTDDTTRYQGRAYPRYLVTYTSPQMTS